MPIQGQFLDQCVGIGFDAVQQKIAIVGDDEEIELVFALRRQQGGIDRALVQFADVIGHDSLQKVAGVGAGEAQNAAREAREDAEVRISAVGEAGWFAATIAMPQPVENSTPVAICGARTQADCAAAPKIRIDRAWLEFQLRNILAFRAAHDVPVWIVRTPPSKQPRPQLCAYDVPAHGPLSPHTPPPHGETSCPPAKNLSPPKPAHDHPQQPSTARASGDAASYAP